MLQLSPDAAKLKNKKQKLLILDDIVTKVDRRQKKKEVDGKKSCSTFVNVI